MSCSKPNTDVQTGSDAEKVKLCAACSNEGDDRPAVKYCIDCNQQICKTCVESHCRIKLLKGHKLIDHENEDAVKLAQLVSSYLACPNHPEKNIEFICKYHDVMCCITCERVHHRTCRQVVEVSSEATGANMSAKTQDITLHLAAAKQHMEEIVKQHEIHKKDVSSEIKTKIPTQVQEIKKKVIKALDEFEKLALTMSNELVQEEMTNNNSAISKWNSHIKAVEEAASLLKTMQQNGSDVHVFVAAKKTEKTLSQIDSAISAQGTKLSLPIVTFQESSHLLNLAKMPSGEIVHVSQDFVSRSLPQYKYYEPIGDQMDTDHKPYSESARWTNYSENATGVFSIGKEVKRNKEKDKRYKRYQITVEGNDCQYKYDEYSGKRKSLEKYVSQ